MPSATEASQAREQQGQPEEVWLQEDGDGAGWQWMWADACIYNDYWGIGRKLASIDPLRWSPRMDREALLQALENEKKKGVKKPVNLGWHKRGKWNNEGRFDSPAHAIIFLGEQAADEQELQQARKRLSRFPESEVKEALKACANDPQLACHQLLQELAPDLRHQSEKWFLHFDLDKDGSLLRVAEAVELSFDGTDTKAILQDLYSLILGSARNMFWDLLRLLYG
ncbi:unnamed protein product [Symbiodinium natans]|uniref:Uncharacterized protein n=1 Tax=Symbiodinium natans TaxID=878477 RepID=A0A812SXC9_9DINO|nr:unnamed protein product [Symbiodinium natans]